jgi:V8-like Glu-specific endopeptidase
MNTSIASLGSSGARASIMTRAVLPTTRVRLALLAICAVAASLAMRSANATADLCTSGSSCTQEHSQPRAQQLAKLTAALEPARLGNEVSARAELSDQEFFSFSGVGALVCTVGGSTRMATAFLVGAFDIAVTVGHPFENNGVWAQPEDCVYTTTDSTGQVRERIPVGSFKAQWQAEPGAYGTTAKDLAVVRLMEASQFAQRTMPLGRFSGNAASVLMIGFSSTVADTLKRKTLGNVYSRAAADGIASAGQTGFTHDMDSRGIASGAPVVDERSGIIIGIHTQASKAERGSNTAVARNIMITMNDWLEKALRAELIPTSTAANTTAQ